MFEFVLFINLTIMINLKITLFIDNIFRMSPVYHVLLIG